jgi:hypothetical protein
LQAGLFLHPTQTCLSDTVLSILRGGTLAFAQRFGNARLEHTSALVVLTALAMQVTHKSSAPIAGNDDEQLGHDSAVGTEARLPLGR